MNERTAVLIYNPRAGRGSVGARRLEVARFCARLNESGIEVEALETNGPNDASRLASEAARVRGVQDIIVNGGDGTLNEALQGIVGTHARLGIWPRGTANVLARELGLPFKPERIAEMIVKGLTRRIYVGNATAEASSESRYFFLMAGVGLDASVVRGVRPDLKRRVGKAAYWYSGLQHLLGWQPIPFNVEVDGHTYPATFAAIGKAAHYGGNLSVTPRARMEEPLFEICLINSNSRLRFLRLLSHTMRGGVSADTRHVRFIRTAHARATGNVSVQVDGELISQLPMTFTVAPTPIEVITAQ
jgi:YegS/Rv2252/BmrU family lipid kinase